MQAILRKYQPGVALSRKDISLGVKLQKQLAADKDGHAAKFCPSEVAYVMSDSISVLHSLTSGFDAQKSGNRNIRAGRRLVRMDLICVPWKRTMTMARIYIVMLYTCQVWQGIRAGCARIREYRGSRRIKSIRRAVAENQHQEHQEHHVRSC